MKFSWDEIDQHIQKKYDLLICSASYEERSLSFVRHCPADRLGFVLVCHIKEFEEYVSKNLSTVRELLEKKQIGFDEATLSHSDPIDSTDSIILALNKLSDMQQIDRVLIDITSFTHEMTLVILRIFHDLFAESQVTFVYSNAETYDPSTPDDKVWLSKGISEIRSVIGFPGNPQPTSQTHLLIVVGYEYDRALSIISELEPSSLSLAFGKSDSLTTKINSSSKHYGAKEHFEELAEAALCYFAEDRIYKFAVSCNDPARAQGEIAAHLHEIGIDSSIYNVVIFALNNKPSTLGVGLFGLENDDVQLCYAPALIYNYGNYSSPGNECYIFNNIHKRE